MEAQAANRRSLFLTLGLVVILAAGLLFAWRVFSFYQKIQSGTLDMANLKFASTHSSEAYLASIAENAPGSGELATNDDPFFGPVNAPVTIVEFADFGCPYSAETSYVVQAIAKKFPKEVRLIYRDFPIPEMHPGADIAAMGGGCAEEQGKFWGYHDEIYAHSGEFTDERILSAAESAGLDMTKFTSCLQSQRYAAEVEKDLQDGVIAGVRGTPTFFVNGAKVEGSVPFAVFTELIHAFLEA